MRSRLRGGNPRRTGRGPRWFLVVVSFALLLLGGAAAFPVLSGRSESPRFSLEAAKDAVAAARDAGAGRWAPRELLEAEAALRVAMTEHRRQEVRLLPFRNFGLARAALRLAEEKAQIATEAARRNLQAAREAAERAIATAERASAEADSLARTMNLDRPRRSLLQQSKIGVEEAKILHRTGELIASRERAERAVREAAEVREAALSLASRYTDPGRVQLWRRWVDDTLAGSRRTGGKAIIVYKERHLLALYDDGKPVRSYHADMGYNMVHPKQRAGDSATPEGQYKIIDRKSTSTYHKALLLNYPNRADRKRFEQARKSGGLPRRASPGGLIEIHGEGGRGKDWTRGCVALSNADMDDLFRRVDEGTPVTIVGSDGRGGIFTDLVRSSKAQESEGGTR